MNEHLAYPGPYRRDRRIGPLGPLDVRADVTNLSVVRPVEGAKESNTIPPSTPPVPE
jgi:hypothetical protein